MRARSTRGVGGSTLDWIAARACPSYACGSVARGHFAQFSPFAVDLETLQSGTSFCPISAAAVPAANSMGAAFLILAAARGNSRFYRLVLCSPMCKLANIPLLDAGPDAARDCADLWSRRRVHPRRRTACSASAHSSLIQPSDPTHARTVRGHRRPTRPWALGSRRCLADSALRAWRNFANPAFPAKLRSRCDPCLRSVDRLVFTPAIDASQSPACRFPISCRIAKHESLWSSACIAAVLAAFDAFIPSPAFWNVLVGPDVRRLVPVFIPSRIALRSIRGPAATSFVPSYRNPASGVQQTRAAA